jgi:hypothetical protein
MEKGNQEGFNPSFFSDKAIHCCFGLWYFTRKVDIFSLNCFTIENTSVNIQWLEMPSTFEEKLQGNFVQNGCKYIQGS